MNPLSPHPARPSPTKGPSNEAIIFLTRPREEALERFPGLGTAFEMLDKMAHAIREARPAAAEIGERLQGMARIFIAGHIAGDAGTSHPDIEEAARTEVAYANLVKAANDRRSAALRCHDLQPEHRARLIRVAEEVMKGGHAVFGIDLRSSRILRARVVARELARLDPRNVMNPFMELELRSIYHREQS